MTAYKILTRVFLKIPVKNLHCGNLFNMPYSSVAFKIRGDWAKDHIPTTFVLYSIPMVEIYTSFFINPMDIVIQYVYPTADGWRSF